MLLCIYVLQVGPKQNTRIIWVSMTIGSDLQALFLSLECEVEAGLLVLLQLSTVVSQELS